MTVEIKDVLDYHYVFIYYLFIFIYFFDQGCQRADDAASRNIGYMGDRHGSSQPLMLLRFTRGASRDLHA